MEENLMEWLMTYGWAILVVIIAIGALVYFDTFSNFRPDLCDCYYEDMALSGKVTENNITYYECSEIKSFLNEEKTRIEISMEYSMFYCDEDLKELILIEND